MRKSARRALKSKLSSLIAVFEFYLDVPADFVFFDQLVLVDVLDASDEKG